MKILTIKILLPFVLCAMTFNAFGQYEPTNSGECISPENVTIPELNPDKIPGSFTLPPTLPPPPPPPPPPSSFERQIYFVHGLGGDVSTWDPVADAVEFGAPGFPARKANSLSPGYTPQSLNGAANDLYDAMDGYSNNGGFDPDYNFIIAHSQGGLVARAADRYQRSLSPSDKVMSGIVTFGTPHQGAKILNNTPSLIQMANDGCNKLLTPLVLEKLANTPFLTWVANIFLKPDIMNLAKNVVVNGFCGFLTDSVLPILTGTFQDPITNDYKVGASYLNQLNADESSSTLSKVAFYGVETEPVLWRQVSSLTVEDPNDFPVFGATNKDNVWVDRADDNENNYNNKYLHWKDEVDNWSIWSWLNPFKKKKDAKKVRDAYKAGRDWWASANTKYKRAIGGIEIVQNQVNSCICYYLTYLGPGDPVQVFNSAWGDMNADCSPLQGQPGFFCNQTTQTTYSTVHYDTDGVVPVGSQTGYPGVNFVDIMPGSNHQQERNDGNTKNNLNDLFDGDYGSFFKTPVK